jgi:antitoxin PrlF
MPTITQKGQVTIPKAIRDKLDIHQGDEIVFEMKDELVALKKRERLPDFKKYIGYLSGHKQKVDEIVNELREGL